VRDYAIIRRLRRRDFRHCRHFITAARSRSFHYAIIRHSFSLPRPCHLVATMSPLYFYAAHYLRDVFDYAMMLRADVDAC